MDMENYFRDILLSSLSHMNTLSKFAEDIKLSAAADSLEGCHPEGQA